MHLANIHERIQQSGGAFVSEPITDQAKFYDIRADEYDNQAILWSGRNALVNTVYFDTIPGLLESDPFNYLDFGCGTGAVTKMFVDRLAETNGLSIAQGFGVDLSSEMCKYAGRNLPNFTIIQGGAEKLAGVKVIDLISSFFHTLGHLTDQELTVFFEGVGRSLKPKGLVCFDVAMQLQVGEHGYSKDDVDQNKQYIAYHSHTLDGKVVSDESGVPIIGTERMFSEEDIAKFTALGGLKLITCKTVQVEHPNTNVGTINELVVVAQKL